MFLLTFLVLMTKYGGKFGEWNWEIVFVNFIILYTVFALSTQDRILVAIEYRNFPTILRVPESVKYDFRLF